MQDFIDTYAWIIGVLALFGLELAPIKLSPISWIGNMLGKLLGIDKINDRLDILEKNIDDNEMDRIRYEILQFSGSLRNGLKRSETDYIHIENIFEKYRKKGGNSYILHEMDYIRECHDKGRIL